MLGGVPHPASLTPVSVRNQTNENASLVDARQTALFNIGHVPGFSSVPFGDTFSSWLGWLVPWGQPLILPPPEASSQDAILRQLIRIGFDQVNGFLAGGVEAWRCAGFPTESANGIGLSRLKQLSDQEYLPVILDVRQRSEFHDGHIKGALNIELGELQEHLDGIPREIPMVTVCAGGMGASMAGSILQRDGRENVGILEESGTAAWIELGYPSAIGGE